MNIHIYKPFEIKIVNEHLSSYEKALVLASFKDLVDACFEDLANVAVRRPFEVVIEHGDINQALDSFRRSTAPDDIKAILICAWVASSSKVIRETTRTLNDFAECASSLGILVKWKIACSEQDQTDKLMVLFSREEAAPEETVIPYYVEEYNSNRIINMPFAATVLMKKGEVPYLSV